MLPNVDSTSLLKNAVRLDEEKILNPQRLQVFDMLRLDKPVLVLLAAGKGTRLKPLTENRSKALAPILDKPVVARVFDSIYANGIKNFVIVILIIFIYKKNINCNLI